MTELSTAAGYVVKFESSTGSGPAPGGGAAAPPASTKPSLESVEQMQSPIYQAKKLGFVAGAYVVPKGADAPEIWQISGYHGSTATLLHQVMGHDKEQQQAP